MFGFAITRNPSRSVSRDAEGLASVIIIAGSRNAHVGTESHLSKSVEAPKAHPNPPSAMINAFRLIGLLVLSWCVMTTTHELGHLLGGWSSGGELQFVELRPWRLPQSHFDPNPRPLLTLWCGPIFGVTLPLGIWLLFRKPMFEFIAAFCMVANGAYLAMGWVSGERYLDTQQLLEQGASPLSIALFSLATLGWGYVWFRRRCIEVISPLHKAEISQHVGS